MAPPLQHSQNCRAACIVRVRNCDVAICGGPSNSLPHPCKQQRLQISTQPVLPFLQPLSRLVDEVTPQLKHACVGHPPILTSVRQAISANRATARGPHGFSSQRLTTFSQTHVIIRTAGASLSKQLQAKSWSRLPGRMLISLGGHGIFPRHLLEIARLTWHIGINTKTRSWIGPSMPRTAILLSISMSLCRGD